MVVAVSTLYYNGKSDAALKKVASVSLGTQGDRSWTSDVYIGAGHTSSEIYLILVRAGGYRSGSHEDGTWGDVYPKFTYDSGSGLLHIYCTGENGETSGNKLGYSNGGEIVDIDVYVVSA